MPHTDTQILKNSSGPPALEHARVIFLVNFLSPNLVEVLREAARGLGRLDVLVSVNMEANRNWHVNQLDLSVIQQRTWTKRKLAHHPGGFVEELFVHVPLDTLGQLKRLRPDCIVSLEMGMRSIQASMFRHFWNKNCRHVLAVYGSERSEAGRGWLRRAIRTRLLKAADVVTFNGPSCQRYLLGQGAPAQRMLPWNYAADPLKPYRGPLLPHSVRPLRLLTVSQLIPRKGLDRAFESLRQWTQSRPEIEVVWSIAGTGPQGEWFRNLTLPPNLQLKLLGHCEPERLQQLYADNPVHFLPTLGDEWGLVVDEALHSGQLVLGSLFSQAVETLIQPGLNGWIYSPEDPASLHSALDALVALNDQQLIDLRQAARQSVLGRTHVESGQQFVAAVACALKPDA